MIDFNKVQNGDYVKQIHGPRNPRDYNLPNPIMYYEVTNSFTYKGQKYFLLRPHRKSGFCRSEAKFVNCFTLVNDFEWVRQPWTEWKLTFNSSIVPGKVFYAKYKTNNRYIKFVCRGISVKASCHKDDMFDLNVGLQLCWQKWKDKFMAKEFMSKECASHQISDTQKNNDMLTKPVANPPTIKKMKNGAKDITGFYFGDYKAKEVVGKDSSLHNLWLCECECGDTIIGTVYDLTHGRIKTVCKKCQNKKNLATTDESEFTTTYDSTDNMEDCIAKDYITPLTNDNNKKELDKQLDNTQDFHGTTRTMIVEKQIDLIEVPTYYHIAHCIPNNLAFVGDTANRINSLWNMKEKIVNDHDKTSFDVGEVVLVDNVFNLILTMPYRKATMEAMRTCLYGLASYCNSCNIKYLAMPKIGCGKNGLEWEKVVSEIERIFNEVLEDGRFVNIVVCCK